MTFDENEIKVIQQVVTNAAKREREDVIGLLMKEGVFKTLGDKGLCVLAEKLEAKNEPIS